MKTIKDLLYQEINHPTLTNWDKTKRRWAKDIKKMPKSSEINTAYQQLINEGKLQLDPRIEESLRIRKIRTLSGVAPFAVMMKPFYCPGKCTYCVQEPGMPKSYMSDEPAAARAKKLKFDPITQVHTRLDQMEKTGHKPEKLEVIVIGGTFSAYPDKYKKEFLKNIFQACNSYKHTTKTVPLSNLPSNNNKILPSISQLQQINQTSKYKVIGLSVETRPDWVTDDEIKLFREYGVTRVQIGVQALDDQILKNIKRGHDLNQVRIATKKLRNAGFKINYHFMPNLPGSNPKKDVEMLKLMFSDPDFRPDTLKIYPCIVIPGTELHDQWKKGEYQPYDDETIAEVLAKCTELVPEYCRIDRLVRDITKKWTAAGTKMTNMRQVVDKKMQKEGRIASDIRAREVRNQKQLNKEVKLKITRYQANDGQEHFIQYTDDIHLYALCRLRFPEKKIPFMKGDMQFTPKRRGEAARGFNTKTIKQSKIEPLFPILQDSALIRELHVFGQQETITKQSNLKTTIHNLKASNPQHQSLGRQLIQKAEQLAQKAGYKKIAIISGVGVRGYYEKLDYHLEETYMVKRLD